MTSTVLSTNEPKTVTHYVSGYDATLTVKPSSSTLHVSWKFEKNSLGGNVAGGSSSSASPIHGQITVVERLGNVYCVIPLSPTEVNLGSNSITNLDAHNSITNGKTYLVHVALLFESSSKTSPSSICGTIAR